MKHFSRWITKICVVALFVGMATVSMRGQWAPKVGEWATYGGDLANTRYSPLDQINASNFNKLQLAFRFKTENLGPRPEFQYQATPLMVNGRLFTTAGTRRAVVALDATTGEMQWMYSMNEGKRGEAAPRQLSGRGLSYWSDGKEERVIYVTPGYMMVALDAKTGRPVPGFGTNGIVDLKQGLDQEGLDLTTAEIGLHSAPIISKDVIVIGAAHREGGAPKSKTNVKGYIRGFDVRTGKRVWIFHTIPVKGEAGFETWDPDAAQYTGNTGVWAQMSADEEAGIVYLPVELPTGDYYGGHRHGSDQTKSPEANLYGESLVALDVKTGQKKWHYQLVHHGMWDFDIPCAPIVMDITVDGKLVKAVAQPTKQNWLYVFDRITGKPVWPIVEKPVEKGDVPGEWYSPTQPFVTKPPAFERQGTSEADLLDFTPELHAEAVKLASSYKMGPIFTPPVVSKWEGPRGTLIIPEVTGGANWQGGTFDPETKKFYIFTNVAIANLSLLPPEGNASDMLYVRGNARNPNPPAAGAGAAPGGGAGLTVRGLPLIKPPYGTITAIDMNKGEQLWRIAHGDTPDNIKNNPALKGLNIPRTGRPGRIGILTTKTLLIAGEGGFNTTPEGRGAYLRAYDKATGADAGQVFMPAPQTGSPMTYSINGTQYIAVAVSGPGFAGELLVYKLGN